MKSGGGRWDGRKRKKGWDVAWTSVGVLEEESEREEKVKRYSGRRRARRRRGGGRGEQQENRANYKSLSAPIPVLFCVRAWR